MLPEVESPRVQSLWLVKKALSSREELDSLSIMNSKACLHLCVSCVLLARSVVARSIHVAMIFYVHILNV